MEIYYEHDFLCSIFFLENVLLNASILLIIEEYFYTPTENSVVRNVVPKMQWAE